ncbi:helix-turn-helix transcriptional regulator [Bradyrhizobium roseum]|uniref:helix-turn-helix transcriptional regulator n=1 Tax=Bradyrhizobium roseum TaxID=3056648 RepID=UPI00260679F5|nr:LuxR C-terminal-related transcriptional regulator [Bradyrhizobium roseus]WKA26882.1 LuxR C-terminal-related transcriptional regulator [Bradyrhizobium roseus]
MSGLRSASELVLSGDFSNRQRLSDLISAVYDAAIESSLWESAIERVAGFVGGAGGGLFCKDVGAVHASIPYRVGFQMPLPVALFQQIYPAAEGHFLGDLEQPIATTDLMSSGELTASELYRQWAEPQGLVDFLSAVVERSTISAAIFGVFRHQRNGVVDDHARRQMKLIAPHIRRAVLIGRMFEFKAAEVATFVDTLDGLSAGMYLVDANGRLIHANAAGHALLAESDILRCVSGRLVAREAQTDRALREVFAAAGQGDAALGTKGIAVPLSGSDGERYIAHALPLTSGARRRAGVVSTAAALFVRKASLAVPSASQAIGSAFKLTPTELRVLMAIVEVGGVPEVASAFGIADTTVRTHVTHLFEKTGTSRQADLVKLVAGYATPLAE